METVFYRSSMYPVPRRVYIAIIQSCWRIQFGNWDAATCYTNTFTHIYNQLNRFTCIIKILDAHQHRRIYTRRLANPHSHIHTSMQMQTQPRTRMHVCCVWELGRRQANCEACKDEVSLLRVNGACPSVGVYRNRKWNEYKNTFKHNAPGCVRACMCTASRLASEHRITTNNA